MGKASRDKGLRTERLIVKLLQDAGIAGERVPLSGSAGGRYSSDVTFPICGREWRAEVKCRAAGFKQLYDWLQGNDVLIIKGDRLPPLVVLDLRRAAGIALKADLARSLGQTPVERFLHGDAA
jgi:hypothetical protein